MQLLAGLISGILQRPLLLMGLIALPLVPLGHAGIWPSRRMALLALLPLAASLSLALIPNSWILAVVLDLLLLALAIPDLYGLPHLRHLSATRRCARVLSLAKPQDVELALTNTSSRSFGFELVDDLPEEFEAEPDRFSGRLGGRTKAVFHYRARALRRGLFRLECLHLRAASRLGLWNRFLKVPVASEVRVYPDMKQLAEYELLARTNRLSLLGLRRSRRIGTENEFERLRDYTLDDDHRHIDWRATARRQELTVRDFQTNQNQQLLFMIDCGRMMTGRSGNVQLMDRALNSMLMLSWIALARGDAVGLLLFADHVCSYVPPRTGRHQVNQFLHVSFDQFARYRESRYDRAFYYLDRKVRKRSLIILISNLIDGVNARVISDHLRIQAGKHLPLAVFLRDHDLYDLAMQPQAGAAARDGGATDLAAEATAAAAAGIVQWREQAIARLGRRGVLTLDVAPDHLTAQLVNRYLEIKARGLL